MLNFIYPTASLRVVGGGEGVWESDSLSSPSPASRSWGQSGSRERGKLARGGEWGTWLALQQPCSGMQEWRIQRAAPGGREGRCSCEQQYGKAPGERTEGRLEKGQKQDATLDFQICTSLNTHTHGHPHTLLLPKLLPKSCASMDYPKRVHLICSQREEFSKFPSIFHRNETETSLESCSESENKLSFCPSSPTKEKHIMVTSWSSLWFLTKKTSKSVKWLSISWQPCKLWTPVLTGNSY